MAIFYHYSRKLARASTKGACFGGDCEGMQVLENGRNKEYSEAFKSFNDVDGRRVICSIPEPAL